MHAPTAPPAPAGEHDDKIRPYHDLLGEMTIEDIAEQLEIPVEAVADYKRRFWDPEPPEVASTPEPVAAAAVVDEAEDDSDPSTRVEMSPEQEAEEQAIKEAQERAAKEAEVAAMRADPRIRAREDAMRALFPSIEAALTRLAHSDSPADARQAWSDLQAAVSGPPPEAFMLAEPTEGDGESAPPVVRAVKTTSVRAEDGRTLKLRRRDVFRGERAAFLWTHHRNLVEPYPPRG